MSPVSIEQAAGGDEPGPQGVLSWKAPADLFPEARLSAISGRRATEGRGQVTRLNNISMEIKQEEEPMELKKYFENAKGTGVMATADGGGKVNAAIYAKPHFMEDGSIAFIMADRLTHHNLQSNGHAAYMFLEEGPGYKGKRLYLKMLREEQDSDLLYAIRSKRYPAKEEGGKPRFLVFFSIEKELPLIGAGEEV